MANVGSIALQLVANTAQFTSGLTKAKSKLSAFGRDVKMMTRNLMPAIGVGALVYGFQQTVKGIEDIVDASDKLGVAAADLDTLRYSAENLGLASTVADDALKFMGRTIGDARLKGGEAAAAFRSLGLPLERLERMGKAAALRSTIDQLSRIKNEYDRASLAQQIFGRGGQELLALVRVGGEGMKRLAAEAKEYGRALSAVDYKAVDRAGDAMERMKHAGMALWRDVVVGISPAVETLANLGRSLVNFFAAGFHGVRALIAAVQEYSFRALTWMSDKVLWLSGKVRKFSDWVPVLGKATSGWRDDLDEWGQWVRDYFEASGETAAEGFGEAFDKGMEFRFKAMKAWGAVWGDNAGRVGSALKNSLGGLGLDAKPQTADKTASALQVESFARIARGVPGVSRDKEISWPAGESVLRAIERNTAKPAAVAG